MVPPGQRVLQLRVALEEVRPVVWRRLLVPGGVRLNRLREMVQAAMGWTDSPLHHFRVGDRPCGGHCDDCPDDELDEKTATVIGAVGSVRRFFYDYDVGDGWEHEVIVEDVTSWPPGLKHAVCVDGERACPPDVGDPGGYHDFLRVLAGPAHEEFEHLRAWSGGNFGPEEFSLAARNIALQRVAIRTSRAFDAWPN